MGSAVGPACFIVTASDLQPLHPENVMAKYADDCYLIVASKNSHTITSELDQVFQWGNSNNLKLNRKKTQELIVSKKGQKLSPPPILQDINRVTSLVVLGITISDKLSFREHATNVLARGNQNLYALKILKANGLVGASLNNVCKSTFFASLFYASPAWWGFLTEEDKSRFNSLIHKAQKWQLDGGCTLPNFASVCEKADSELFKNILQNSNHVLHQLLPPVKDTQYNLRPRAHNRTLPRCLSEFYKHNFIPRMIFKDSY